MSLSSNDLAEKRTDWSEDRTLLANERTFGGWMRTGLASLALGLGVQAIFKEAEPTWAAKAVATVFIVVAIIIFWSAWRSTVRVRKRLDKHSVEPLPPIRMGLITALFIAGGFTLGAVLWVL